MTRLPLSSGVRARRSGFRRESADQVQRSDRDVDVMIHGSERQIGIA